MWPMNAEKYVLLVNKEVHNQNNDAYNENKSRMILYIIQFVL